MRAAKLLLILPASVAGLGVLLAGCASPGLVPAAPAARDAAPERPIFTEVGLASWYGNAHQGKPTADGERFDLREMTAAHRSLPFGTVVRVKNEATGRSVKVRINDRGPYGKNRVIDLSAAAGAQLGIRGDGVATVRLQVFPSDQPRAATRPSGIRSANEKEE